MDDDIYQNPQFADEEPYVRYQVAKASVNVVNPQRVGNARPGNSCASVVKPTKQATERFTEARWPKRWKVFAVVGMIFLVFLSVLVSVVLVKVDQAETNQINRESQPDAQSHGDSPIKSCLDLKDRGETRSGYYQIQSDQDGSPFETYCDMATSGGGWTLVASVHENDIEGKCTTGDKWFSRERKGSNDFVSRNWENKFSFGSVKRATSNDYKSPGYYSINASDVLVRHVPNNEEVEETKGAAFLEYHTENNFLKTYGGNLYAVYTRHYNLTPVPQEKVVFADNAEMLDALADNASDIISNISHFYHYKYSNSTSYRLLNSDNDNLFYSSYGMQVYVSPCHTINYGDYQQCGNVDVFTSSRKTVPFFALTTIGNHLNSQSSYYYHVTSYQRYSSYGSSYASTLTSGNFTLKYNAYCHQRYSGISPRVCDVIYVVSNKEEWKSSNFSFSSLSVSSAYVTQHIQNYPRNIVVGYTMLSREYGRSISQSNINSVVGKILEVISKFSSVGNINCDDSDLHLVQPVKYTIGGAAVLGDTPTTLHDSVTPGFVQFRARNTDGVAFALCPAVRINTCDSQYLCVGGVASGESIQKYCNDYLYWNNGSSLSSLNLYGPNSSSRSRQYVESTLLIFYR